MLIKVSLNLVLFDKIILSQPDKEVLLSCVQEILEAIDEDNDGEITKDEFVNNAMKSQFIKDLMGEEDSQSTYHNLLADLYLNFACIKCCSVNQSFLLFLSMIDTKTIFL